MKKFKQSLSKKEVPPISTASLPDIVFILLFFFMVSVTMRDTSLKVKIKLPNATEISKLERKSLVSYIFVGEPLRPYQSKFGIAPRLQLNDVFADLSEIPAFIIAEREVREEAERPLLITSLKVDANTKMGIVNDVKQELRKAAALHINYSARKAQQ